MSLDVLLIAGAAVMVALIAYLFVRGRQQSVDPEAGGSRRTKDDVDTLAAWPPEVTRLLTSGERSAHEVLAKALPECMIFAQVPLARFVKVPRRHSYAEWLTRVGHLCADFIICDRASLVIGAVLLQTIRDSERSDRRRARMTRVLKAAGVKVFAWREEALPTPQAAREQILQRTGVPDTATPIEPVPARPQRSSGAPVPIPLPEVVALDDHSPRQEPPPSTWFDDLDSGRMPLDPAKRQQGGR
jgi:Protein of unknown function (DUF2726)